MAVMYESDFERMALDDPEALVAELPGLEPWQLTYALEHLGTHAPNEVAVPAILDYLFHDVPVVREGAIMGADSCTADPRIVTALEVVVRADSVENLRKEPNRLRRLPLGPQRGAAPRRAARSRPLIFFQEKVFEALTC